MPFFKLPFMANYLFCVLPFSVYASLRTAFLRYAFLRVGSLRDAF